MFFSCLTRNVSAIFLPITIIVAGAVHSIEPVTSNVVEQIIKSEEIVYINTESEIYSWKLDIPKINLSANISDGTDEETMNKYIGHFKETNRYSGNIGLAAHNRGYPVNYFKDLKNLEVGDEVYYTYLTKTRQYKIDKISVIKDTNWKPLENTEENRITMITCIANKPEYRLCIQGIEIGGNE